MEAFADAKKFKAELKEARELEKQGKLVEAYYQCQDTLKRFESYLYYPKLQYGRGKYLAKHLEEKIIKADVESLCKEDFEALFLESLEEILSRPKLSHGDHLALTHSVTDRMGYNFLASKKDDEQHYNFVAENMGKYFLHFANKLQKSKYYKLTDKIIEKANSMGKYLEAMPTPRCSIDRNIKQRVLQRTHWHCTYCGRSGWWDKKEVDLQFDHILPFSKGGKNELENLVAACTDCNKEKGDARMKNSEGQFIETYDMLVEYSKSIKSAVVLTGSGTRYRKPSFSELYYAGFKCQNAKCKKTARDGAKLYMCVGDMILCKRCSTGSKPIESF